MLIVGIVMIVMSFLMNEWAPYIAALGLIFVAGSFTLKPET